MQNKEKQRQVTLEESKIKYITWSDHLNMFMFFALKLSVKDSVDGGAPVQS